MERHIDIELRRLKDELLKMASLAEASIGQAIKALVDRDANLVGQVIASDEAINMAEIEIDELCLKLLASTPSN